MAPDFAHLAKDIQQKVATLVPNNDQLRQSLLQAAQSLVAELETPTERVARLCYVEPFIYMAIRVLLDLDVFRILADSDGPKTAAQLAQVSGADPRLLERFLKHVATNNFVHETGPDEYAANGMTRCLATTEAEGVIKECYSLCAKVSDDLPDFLKETNYANPTDKDKSPFKRAFKTDQHYFDYIFTPGREEKARAFEAHMRFKTIGPKWFDSNEILHAVFGSEQLKKEDVLLVDVGGSTGYDILNFHKAHPDIIGSLILQDLPGTIQSLDSKAMIAQGVEPMSYDFFTPQPVQHAKAYYLKMVLHDWPDIQCREILSNLKPALKPGYSRILLNEIVIPEVNAKWFETSVDMIMMTAHAAQERREGEWRALVESVDGLRVRKIWTVEGASEKVIEIELA